MLGGGIPSGLAGLLAKMGLIQQPGTKDQAKGMQAGKPNAKGAMDKPGLEKGALLGKDGELAAGLGFAGKDKTTQKKNQVEEANVNRFLSEVQDPEMKKMLGAQDAKPEAKDKAEQEDAPQNMREERGADVRREEGREEARQLAQKEAQEEKGARMEKDAEAQAKEREKQQDEEDRPGGGWVAEELEGEEDDDGKRGLRDADALGEAHRCRHALEDGTGCLRKPVKGTPYCREHGVRPVGLIDPNPRV